MGFDSIANRTANEARFVKGHLVYIYAGLRTLAGWHHATFQVTVDGKRHTVTGYNVAVANSKAYGGGIQLVPHAELDDGRLDVMLVEAHSKLRWVRGALSAFKGGHVNDPAIRWLTGTEIEVERRPSVHRLRGRRPDCRPACHDHGHEADPARHRTLMLRLKLTLARALRALSRRLARTGGTTLPGRVLLRLDPSSIRVLGARLERGSVLVSATNGKTTTASMLAAVLERSGAEVVHNRAGSNMNWGVATALLDAGRAPAQIGLFEVDEAWLATVASELDPSLVLLSNLFRDQLDRYGELDLLADRWAELVAEREGRTTFVLNADDPLVADLGRERERVVYFGVEDRRCTGSSRWSTPRTRSAAATAAPSTSTRRCSWDTWATTAARAVAASGRARRCRPRRSRSTACRARTCASRPPRGRSS